jgi:hypothetical protein
MIMDKKRHTMPPTTRMPIFKMCYCVAARLGIERSNKRRRRAQREREREEKWALVAWL